MIRPLPAILADRRPGRRSAFTLVELLVVVAIVVALLGVLLPALGGAQRAALDVKCKANLRSLGMGIKTYAANHRELYPPLAVWNKSPVRYWWGERSRPPDFSRGIITPYLDTEAGEENSVFECPEQPWGTYVSQGGVDGPTTTYGYNGYYLCPPATPGWSYTIGRRSWQTQTSVKDPGKVFVLADTLMSWGGGVVSNNCLLDPPWIYTGGGWQKNASTTLCFRHSGHANVFFADGHVDSVWPTEIIDSDAMIGYVGESNAPHYVPDWETWTR